jgi:hypothetical protein
MTTPAQVGLATHEQDLRWQPRRPVYLGEGIRFEVETTAARLEAEAIDVTPAGIGLAITGSDGELAVPAQDDIVSVRYAGPGASGISHAAAVRHTGTLRSGSRLLPRLGLALAPGAGRAEFECSDAFPAFATATCPWLFQERLSLPIAALGASGMTVRTADAPLVPGGELDFELHLSHLGTERARGRLTGPRADGDEVGVAWVDPPRWLLKALSRYLLAADASLSPAALRASGLAVGGIDGAVTYDCARTEADYEEILALRLRAHQAEGHMDGATAEDLRSPYDAHSRHLTCRFGGRIVGYVRVIFVDGDPARSQYVSLGGHEVPQWLWDAGFVEAGAGATDPDFQRAGLYVPLMQHVWRVAVQAGHRYILGACPDELVGMYGAMGFDVLEERMVAPKPGWSFRSHLLIGDAARLLREPATTPTGEAMRSAVSFAARER